jgi:hypothetical protein
VTFAAATNIVSENSPGSIATADFNNDGWPDLVNTAGDGVTVFIRTIPVDTAIISGNPQTVPLNTAFAPLSVYAQDASAVPVQLVTVDYTLAAGGNGASGTFGGSTAVLSDSDGVATAPTLTANLIVGPFTVKADVHSKPFGGNTSSFMLANTIAAPLNLIATAASSLPITVSITWEASPYADGYDIRRYSVFPGTFTTIATNVQALTFSDTTAGQDTAYLYAVNGTKTSGGGLFAYDLATTVLFTDPAITAASTKIKEVHFTQLQLAVHKVQTLLLGGIETAFIGAPFTPNSTKILSTHLSQLRTALDNARLATGVLPPIVYTHAPGGLVYADDIRDLRNGVK